MSEISSLTEQKLEIHRKADTPRIDRITRPELIKLANDRLKQQFIPILTNFVELTPRQSYVSASNLMDVYRPGRWDTSTNYIFMDAIVQGQNVGEWDGSVIYAQLTPTTSGQHLIAVHFTGYKCTMQMDGPWGTTSATTQSTSDAGAVLAYATAEAGKTIYFDVSCKVPNNLAGLGYVSAVEIIS